jgi:BolA family transcriptional regulator, general stress-responsive regulator
MSMSQRIQASLTDALAPVHIDLENESHRHNVAPGSESHWKLVVVSAVFSGKRLVQRQRAVYGALSSEMADGIHALSMKTLTPDEWAAQGGQVTLTTPPCAGGSTAGG